MKMCRGALARGDERSRLVLVSQEAFHVLQQLFQVAESPPVNAPPVTI